MQDLQDIFIREIDEEEYNNLHNEVVDDIDFFRVTFFYMLFNIFLCQLNVIDEDLFYSQNYELKFLAETLTTDIYNF